MVGWLKMPLGKEVGLDPSDILLDGDPAPLPKRGQSPQFSAHVYCAQTAGWIKMPLGMEVGLGPDHIVLDGHPAPPPPKRWHNQVTHAPRYIRRYVQFGCVMVCVTTLHL